MGVYTREFLSCSKCDYVHVLRSGTVPSTTRTKWVYSNGSSEPFPLLQRLGWCHDCNSIQSHEHVPSGPEINAFVEEIKGELAKFVSGQWKWYGAPMADYARSVIQNRNAWHEWSRTRNRGRCLTCATTHVSAIDPVALVECKGELPFAHPECGGALRFGTDEKGFHMNLNLGQLDPDRPITYLTYSYAGFPTGDRLAEAKRKLDEKHPRAIVDLHTAVVKVFSGQAKNGNDLTLPSFSDLEAHGQLGSAVFDFIIRELEDGEANLGAATSLARRFPEIHELTAVLIREMAHKLTSARRVRSMAAQTTTKPAIAATTALHLSPFHLLSVSVRDDRRRIVVQAEEQALHLDAEMCQKARTDLTNPRTRLSAEVAWLPGLSPRKASVLVEKLKSQPWDIRQEEGLPQLAKANLLAAASEVIDATFSSDEVADFVQGFALLVDDIDTEDVLRSINEDRVVSGFPEVRDIDLIEAELAERKRYYRNALKAALNKLNFPDLVSAMTMVVENATLGGEVHACELIDELVDAYAVETQGVLAKESQDADRLMRTALETAKSGETAVRPLIDELESVVRTWDRIAQPIQLSAKARGLEHEPSKEIAYSIRSLAIDLFNEHDLLVQSQQLSKLLSELFSELPEFAERVSSDMQTLSDIAKQRQKSERELRKWEKEIAFSAEFGVIFKDTLSISAKGISWKKKTYPLESITRVSWGGVRHSINGIPTGTDYTVAFGDNKAESIVSIKCEATYTEFIDKLWRAVCVRLMTDILKTLKSGSEVHFGEAAVRDDGVTLIKRKYFGFNETVRYSWSQVKIWSADGSFVIGAKDDNKAYSSLSYILVPNTRLLEQIVRLSFKQSSQKRLSDLLG